MLDTGLCSVLRSPVTLEFRILGPLEVSDETGHVALGGPKQRGLLAILVLEAGRVVPTDRLVDSLWGEEAPRTATASLQNAVGRLRRALGSDVLEHLRARLPPQRRSPSRSMPDVSSRRSSIRGGFPRRSVGRCCSPRSHCGVDRRSQSSRSTTSRRRRSDGSRSCDSLSSASASTRSSSSGNTVT